VVTHTKAMRLLQRATARKQRAASLYRIPPGWHSINKNPSSCHQAQSHSF